MANYEKVLRELHYSHSKPQNLNTRSFTVVCSELDGRFMSNSYKVQVGKCCMVFHLTRSTMVSATRAGIQQECTRCNRNMQYPVSNVDTFTTYASQLSVYLSYNDDNSKCMQSVCHVPVELSEQSVTYRNTAQNSYLSLPTGARN